VTFPDGGVPDDSRIFWLYDRGPDGSSWYLYDLFPEDNWTTMTGTGSTWTASIPLEPGRTSIDLVTTHTVTIDGNTIPISAPYTRVALDGGPSAVPLLPVPGLLILTGALLGFGARRL
jgi:hypothetical protein